MRHDLLAHIEAGAFGLPASGCVACYPGGGDGCSTPGCPGDPRYAPPGRRHMDGCRHLLPPEQP